MTEPTAGPAFASLFSITHACQALVGALLDVADDRVLDRAAATFSDLPTPGSYAEALLIAAVLARFTKRFAHELHCRVHEGDPMDSCPFDCERYAIDARVDPDDFQDWNAGSMVTGWMARFHADLEMAHRPTLGIRARRELHMRLAESLRVGDLARTLGCSVSVLRRRFERESGESVRNHRIRLRLIKVIDYLRLTDWKVEAIAREVGWNSKKDLYRALHRTCCLTPGTIRQMSSEQADRVIATLLQRRVH